MEKYFSFYLHISNCSKNIALTHCASGPLSYPSELLRLWHAHISRSLIPCGLCLCQRAFCFLLPAEHFLHICDGKMIVKRKRPQDAQPHQQCVMGDLGFSPTSKNRAVFSSEKIARFAERVPCGIACYNVFASERASKRVAQRFIPKPQ